MTIAEEAIKTMKLAEKEIKQLRYALEECIIHADNEDKVIMIAKDALRQE